MTDFTFHTRESAPAQAQALLAGIEKGFGFIPNMFAYMAEAPTTIEAYLALNDLVSKTSLTPAQQQVALLSVSIENGCDFCSVAHRAIGKMKGVNTETLDALNNGNPIPDKSDQAISVFARTITKRRGHPSELDLQNFLAAGFTKQQVLEIILIISIKTLSNYINHLTNAEPNKELLAML